MSLFSYQINSDHYCIIRRGSVEASDEFDAIEMAKAEFGIEIGKEDENLQVSVQEIEI